MKKKMNIKEKAVKKAARGKKSTNIRAFLKAIC